MLASDIFSYNVAACGAPDTQGLEEGMVPHELFNPCQSTRLTTQSPSFHPTFVTQATYLNSRPSTKKHECFHPPFVVGQETLHWSWVDMQSLCGIMSPDCSCGPLSTASSKVFLPQDDAWAEAFRVLPRRPQAHFDTSDTASAPPTAQLFSQISPSPPPPPP